MERVVPSVQRSSRHKLLIRALASVFWDRDAILLGDYLEKGATSTAKYYVALLDKLKQQLVCKH
jgi:hypothetical protein